MFTITLVVASTGWAGERLTGDWGGARTDWEDKGVTIEADVLQTIQGVVDGGLDTGSEYLGSADIWLKLDTQKMGLWPGGFLNILGEGRWGNALHDKTGTVTSPNTDSLFPLPDEDTFTLSSVTFMQFLSESFGLFAGKLETLGGDMDMLAGSRGKENFLNQNLVFDPVTLATVPYSALGGGGVHLLDGGMGSVTITALDANGQPNTSGFSDAFDDGTVLSAEARVPMAPNELPGQAKLGAIYSDKDFNRLGDLDRFLLSGGGEQAIRTESDSWAVYGGFDQYVQGGPEADQGLGIFGRAGLADADTNPVEWSFALGLSGHGLIPGRSQDKYGLAYYYIGASSEIGDVFTSLVGLEDGQGGEVFYNMAVSQWLHVTLDFQVVEPGLTRADTAYISGLRVKSVF